MVRTAVRTGIETGVLIGVIGLVVWATGRPSFFPSLGATAFSLALREPEHTTARRVLGGHALGVVFALLVYHGLADGLTIRTAHEPFSLDGLLLSASAALSIALTAGSMIFLRAAHPAACATTLIIALGLMPGLVECAVFLLSVALLFSIHRAYLSTERRWVRGRYAERRSPHRTRERAG